MVKGKTRSLSYAEICRATQSGTGAGPLIATRNFYHRQGGISLRRAFLPGRGQHAYGPGQRAEIFALQDCGHAGHNPELALGQDLRRALRRSVTRSTRIWCSTSAARCLMRTCATTKVRLTQTTCPHTQGGPGNQRSFGGRSVASRSPESPATGRSRELRIMTLAGV